MKRLSEGDQFRLVTNVNKNTNSSTTLWRKWLFALLERGKWKQHLSSPRGIKHQTFEWITRSDAPTEFQRSRSWASPYIIFMWSACISESLVFPRSIHSWRKNLNGPIVVHLPKVYLVTKLLFLVKSWDFQFEITKETATSLKLSLCFRKLLVLKPFHSTSHCDEWVSCASEKRHSVTGSKSFI